MMAVTFNSGGRTNLTTLPCQFAVPLYVDIARPGRWEFPSIAPIRHACTVETAPLRGGARFVVECQGAPVIAASVAWQAECAQETWSGHCALYATLFQEQRDSLDEYLSASAEIAHMWQVIRSNTAAYPPPMPSTVPWVATLIYPNVYIQRKLGLLTDGELQIILASTSVYAMALHESLSFRAGESTGGG
jgi:hypothetical protein